MCIEFRSELEHASSPRKSTVDSGFLSEAVSSLWGAEETDDGQNMDSHDDEGETQEGPTIFKRLSAMISLDDEEREAMIEQQQQQQLEKVEEEPEEEQQGVPLQEEQAQLPPQSPGRPPRCQLSAKQYKARASVPGMLTPTRSGEDGSDVRPLRVCTHCFAKHHKAQLHLYLSRIDGASELLLQVCPIVEFTTGRVFMLLFIIVV